MTALTIILPALIVAAIIIYAAVLVHAWRHWDGTPSHSLDCRDLYRFGLYATDCPAAHGTDYFASPRAQVELENALDGQIGFPK